MIMESPNAMQRSNSKSKGKSSLLMCFKSVTMDEEDGMVLSPAAEDGGESLRKKKGGNRWQPLRAALKGTTLMKKIISRRKANKDKMSISNSTVLEDNKISTPQRKSTLRATSNASSTFGRSSSALASSSSISSTSSLSRADYLTSTVSSPRGIHSPRSPLTLNNRTGVTKHKQIYIDYRREGCYYGTYTATCMLLISLLFLVMWGRSLAIVYTSIWFYMVRPVRRRPCNYKYGLQSGEITEFDSVQYRRKIIMQGLLERSHSNVSLASCNSMGGRMFLASGSMRKS